MTPRLIILARPMTWRTPDGITHMVSRAAAPCGADLDLAPLGSSQEEADCMACIASWVQTDTVVGVSWKATESPTNREQVLIEHMVHYVNYPETKMLVGLTTCGRPFTSEYHVHFDSGKAVTGLVDCMACIAEEVS